MIEGRHEEGFSAISQHVSRGHIRLKLLSNIKFNRIQF